jgi:hypothetical protein
MLTASLLEDSEYLPKIHSLDDIFNRIPVSTFHYALLVITGFSFMAQAIVRFHLSLLSFTPSSIRRLLSYPSYLFALVSPLYPLDLHSPSLSLRLSLTQVILGISQIVK